MTLLGFFVHYLLSMLVLVDPGERHTFTSRYASLRSCYFDLSRCQDDEHQLSFELSPDLRTARRLPPRGDRSDFPSIPLSALYEEYDGRVHRVSLRYDRSQQVCWLHVGVYSPSNLETFIHPDGSSSCSFRNSCSVSIHGFTLWKPQRSDRKGVVNRAPFLQINPYSHGFVGSNLTSGDIITLEIDCSQDVESVALRWYINAVLYVEWSGQTGMRLPLVPVVTFPAFVGQSVTVVSPREESELFAKVEKLQT